MEHHDHISSHRQRLAVAGLLIAAVSKVALMANHIQPERVRDADRGVRAGVIDEEDSVGVPLRDVAHHLDQRLGGAVRRKHDHATRPRTAPMQLAQRYRVGTHGHALDREVRSDREGADRGRPEVDRQGEVDGCVCKEQHSHSGVRPAEHSGQGEVGHRKTGDHQQSQVVNVLMRTENKRCRDGKREVEAWLVGTPAQREGHQGQEQDEDDERHNLAASGDRLEDVAQRVHGGVGVYELIGIWQASGDRPGADRPQVRDHWSDPKPDHRYDAHPGERAGEGGQRSP